MLHAVSCIIDSRMSNNVFKKIPTLVFYSMLTGAIIVPFLFLFGTPGVPSWPTFLVIFSVSAIEVLYLFPWYKALRSIDTSISVALFSLGKISLPILAWLIVGEKLHGLQYVGFAIILAASFILNFDRKKMKLNIAFWMMLMVSLILALESVLDKYALNRIDFVTLMYWQTLFSMGLASSFLLFPKVRADIKKLFPAFKTKFRIFILNDALTQFGSLAIIVALSRLPVLVTESISSSQSIFTILFGFIAYKLFGGAFKEHFQKKQIAKKLFFFACIIFGIVIVLWQ